MIGKAYWAIFKYYDSSAHMMAFKKRPVLIIGQADESDYVVLPISRVTRREHIDQKYDFKMQAADYPKLSLKATSYIRTHKQPVANIGELADPIADFKNEYPDAYVEVIALVEEFQKKLVEDAL
ncbi:MAG TPA: hypothetical protein H9704_12595 [Candidatus Enterocloster excrementipullorum]|uniref:PemK-like protein n=1 Tax=Candidatus Enterocloster excrementipullorum TaxID=2838559 RepID=A0A9D2SI19_9FIRM|nr:hypothetical protein [Candidatus Enterocloster excrementipullorum]